MADTDPLPTPPPPPLVRSTTAVVTTCGMPLGRGSLLAGALFVFASGMMAGQVARSGAGSAPAPAVRVDPCALPDVSMEFLSPAERTLVVRRALACADLSHGRIDGATYRATIAALDAAIDAPPAPLLIDHVPFGIAPFDPSPPAMIWGASVRAMSSQYGTDDWSAKRALGAPDVYPVGGDQVNAWASLGADDRAEFLEIGLERPARLSAVEIYETFNPGAVSRVELIGESGTRTLVHRGSPAAMAKEANLNRQEFACTGEPIVAIRVSIDSTAVEGWNEIDAIGGQPCAQ